MMDSQSDKKSAKKVLRGVVQLQNKENDPGTFSDDLSHDLEKLTIDDKKPKDKKIKGKMGSNMTENQDKSKVQHVNKQAQDSGIINMTKEEYERAKIGSSGFLYSSALVGMEIDGESNLNEDNKDKIIKESETEKLPSDSTTDADAEKASKSKRNRRRRKIRVKLAKVQDSDETKAIVSTSRSNSNSGRDFAYNSTPNQYQENGRRTHTIRCLDSVEIMEDQDGRLKFRVWVNTYSFSVDDTTDTTIDNNNTPEKPQEESIDAQEEPEVADKKSKAKNRKNIKKWRKSSKNQKVKEFKAGSVEGFRGNEPVDKLLKYIDGSGN